MFEGHDIVCIALPNWEGDYTKSTVKIMSALAEKNRILYVDYPFTVKDVVMKCAGRGEAPVKRMLGIDSRLRTLQTQSRHEVSVLTPPPVLSINWVENGAIYDRLLRVNAAIVKRAVRAAMRTLEMKNPIVINAFNPFMGLPLAGAFNEKLLVYYCYDEITAAQWAGKHGGEIERRFIARTDAVITTSAPLQQAKSEVHNACLLVKNGVDFDLFNAAAERQNPKSDTEVKTVGYIGSIDSRLDYQLLARAAEMAPDIHFAYVGRVVSEEAKQRLGGCDNVTFHGPKPADKLPEFLSGFDLGVIPFERSDFNRNVYPLKINEYLAAGKPVVMTDFADLSDFADVVRVEKTDDEFIAGIRAELDADTPSKQKARIEMAMKNSWENRAVQFGDHLDNLLASREEDEHA